MNPSAAAEPRPARGLVERIAAAYRDPGASMRELLASRPSDGVLLSLLMIAGAIALMGDAFGAVAAEAALRAAADGAADPEAAERFRERIGTAFVARLLLFPIAVYLAAALLFLAVRAAGGAGGGYESRAAMIWALVVVAPVALALAAAEAVAVASGAAEAAAWRWGFGAVSVAVGGWALWLWAACVAAAHGFRSRRAVMAAALGVLAGAAGLWIGAAALTG